MLLFMSAAGVMLADSRAAAFSTDEAGLLLPDQVIGALNLFRFAAASSARPICASARH
jgi:hypothetical protein